MRKCRRVHNNVTIGPYSGCLISLVLSHFLTYSTTFTHLATHLGHPLTHFLYAYPPRISLTSHFSPLTSHLTSHIISLLTSSLTFHLAPHASHLSLPRTFHYLAPRTSHLSLPRTSHLSTDDYSPHRRSRDRSCHTDPCPEVPSCLPGGTEMGCAEMRDRMAWHG